jgi:CubicO group peptidase (beta-lactamase class C family)/imidazolonepropionase-like amidohydrolase
MSLLHLLSFAIAQLSVTSGTQSVVHGSPTDSARLARIERIERRLLPATPLTTDRDSGWTVLDRLRAHHVPGLSVAVVHAGQIAWTRSYGVRSAAEPHAITDSTVFQAGSLSKPLATFGVLRLVSNGKLGLDDDVNRYLTRWKVPTNRFTRAAPVTLRHLLSHRAGVNVRGFDGYQRGAALPTLVDVLNGAPPANSPPITIDTMPGAINRYSGGGFEIAQLALEDVTRQHFDAWMRANIFNELGLRRTTYSEMDDTSNAGDIALGHTGAGGLIDGGWRVLPEMAAASLWSTPSELARVVIALQQAAKGERVAGIPANVSTEMLRLHGENQGLGIGLKGGVPFRFSHAGSNDGYRAMLIGYLDRDDGIVLMTNGDGGNALLMEYARAVAREYGWADLVPRTRAVVPVSTATRAALVGRYRLGPNWEIEISELDGQLVAGPRGRRPLPILAETDSTFFFPSLEGVQISIIARGGKYVSEISWQQGARETPGRRVAPPTLLRDVTVIDGTGSPARPHTDILVADGRISAVGASGTIPPPPETRVLDFSGRFVIPGLIDAHVHLATFEREPRTQDALLKAALLGGVTSVRDMGGNIDELRAIAARASRAAAGLSRVFYSAVMSGPGTMWFANDRRQYFAGQHAVGRSPGVREVTPGVDAATVIADARRTGATGIKLYAGLPRAVLAELAAAARRQGMRVWGHLDIEPGRPSDVVAAGVEAVSHANMFISQVTPRPSATDSASRHARSAAYPVTRAGDPAMRRLVADMRAHGTALDATLHVMDPTVSGDTTRRTASANATFAFAVGMTRAAHAAGVPILAGTDAIGRGTPNMHHELQLLVDRVGLSPSQALHAATLANARALGAADSIGSIAVGKKADLVVLEHDPLLDIANTLTVTSVFRDGIEHRRTSPLTVERYMRAPRKR